MLLSGVGEVRLSVQMTGKSVSISTTNRCNSQRQFLQHHSDRRSDMSRVVVLIELTCCADEGIRAAQLRKETRYTQLVSGINETKVWKASLRTLEIGARGLVGISSHKVFVELGFSSIQVESFLRLLFAAPMLCTKRIITWLGLMELT